MLFRDLYNLVTKDVAEPPVRFEDLRTLVNQHHAGVGEVKVWAISYPKPNHQAHYVVVAQDRTSAYDEEFDIAEIRYCDALDGEPRELRFALTKELMHVFDSDEEKTDTREKFISLLREIQNKPLSEHASAMFNSELGTRWMALIILCPKPFRDALKDDRDKLAIADFEIAEKLDLPEWLVPFLMDPYYDKAFDSLMAKG